MDYTHAHEVKRIAEELIDKHHDHLDGVKIEYVFLSQPPKDKGKELLGRAKKKSGLDAYLYATAAESKNDPKDFFVIEISQPGWDILDQKQKRALVDHELCHLWVNEEGKLTMLPHDVEEFSQVIKRHGLYLADIEHFAAIAAKHVKQIDLPLAETSTPEESKIKVLKGGNGKAEAQKANGKAEAEKPKSNLGSLKDQVAKKRGRAPAARA